VSPEERLAALNIHRLPQAEPPIAPARLNASEKQEGAKQLRFALVKFNEILMMTTSIYLVKNLLPRVGLVVIWGPPKCGKSFWTFDLLMHAALGWEYRGLRVKPGPIVYLVLEGHDGFRRRIEAFRREHPGSDDAPFYLMFIAIDLIRDHKALIESIVAQLPEGVKPAAVAIDTLNRSLSGSENKDEDMAAYIRAADAVRNAFDCLVPIIHHCGHNGERPRGHSSLIGAVDVQIAVRRDDDENIIATVEFAKDAPGGLEIVSRLAVVDVGVDEDGDAMTSCIVEPVGDASAKKAVKEATRLTKGAKIALRALHEAIDELGEVPPASSHIPPKVKVVSIDQWRDRAFKTGISTSDKTHAKNTAFNRASEALIAARKIGIWEPLVWPAL
jgi:AAA domain